MVKGWHLRVTRIDPRKILEPTQTCAQRIYEYFDRVLFFADETKFNDLKQSSNAPEQQIRPSTGPVDGRETT